MPSTDPSAVDGPVDERSRGAGSSGDGPAAGGHRRVGGDRGFPRDARLLNGRAYDAVFGDNRRVADRYWTVLAHRVRTDPIEPTGEAPSGAGAAGVERDGGARLGLAVAKKRARRAVDRNRIKRVARESFRHARGALAGHHLVVMNRDAATSASAAELRTALDALWSRLLRPAGPDARRGGGRGRGERSLDGRGAGERPADGLSPPARPSAGSAGDGVSGPAAGETRNVASGERRR